MWALLKASVGIALVNLANGEEAWATAGEIAQETDEKMHADTALRRCRKLVDLGLLQCYHFAYYDIFSRNYFCPTRTGMETTLNWFYEEEIPDAAR